VCRAQPEAKDLHHRLVISLIRCDPAWTSDGRDCSFSHATCQFHAWESQHYNTTSHTRIVKSPHVEERHALHAPACISTPPAQLRSEADLACGKRLNNLLLSSCVGSMHSGATGWSHAAFASVKPPSKAKASLVRVRTPLDFAYFCACGWQGCGGFDPRRKIIVQPSTSRLYIVFLGVHSGAADRERSLRGADLCPLF
jgi:hypothetical protein